MSPPAVCRVLGCEDPTVYEIYGARVAADGRPIYGCECARHELARWQDQLAEASFREVQLLHLLAGQNR